MFIISIGEYVNITIKHYMFSIDLTIQLNLLKENPCIQPWPYSNYNFYL